MSQGTSEDNSDIFSVLMVLVTDLQARVDNKDDDMMALKKENTIMEQEINAQAEAREQIDLKMKKLAK